MKTRPDPSTKPYYRCLSCPRFRKLCGGRPTRDLDQQNWCEYMCDVMDIFHLTNAQVAKEADVSLKTIEKIRSINCEQDIMRGIARRVEQAVLGPVGNHTCYLDHDHTPADQIAKLEAELAVVRKDLAREREENDRKAKIIDGYLERK